jgi:RNA polymerase sigma-70 factor (family 1)
LRATDTIFSASIDSPKDEQLYAAVKDFDSTEAYKQLFLKYYKPLLFFLSKFVADPVIREEVVQEVFFQFWEKRKTILINSSFKAYLFVTTKNRALKYLKMENFVENAKASFAEQAESLDYATPEKKMLDKEQQKKIENLIENLPKKAQEVCRLRFLKRMKQREIAELLGISESAVEKHLVYIRNYFRQHFNLMGTAT